MQLLVGKSDAIGSFWLNRRPMLRPILVGCPGALPVGSITDRPPPAGQGKWVRDRLRARSATESLVFLDCCWVSSFSIEACGKLGPQQHRDCLFKGAFHFEGIVAAVRIIIARRYKV